MSATMLGRWSPFRARAREPRLATSRRRDRQRRRAASPSPCVTRARLSPPPSLFAPASRQPRHPRARGGRVASVDRSGPAATSRPARGRAPPAVSAIAEEAALVGAALRKLREQDDAAGALALLDARDARFGAAGTLADEARTTRVEALLRLGQHGRALALLDAAAPRPSGRGRALLATRGELRADAGRCREADADFDALLADDAASDDIGRARALRASRLPGPPRR